MPIGPFANFDACVKHMMEKQNYSEEVAKKVCGKMEQQQKQKGSYFAYKASLSNYYVREGKNYAKIRVIDTNPSQPSGDTGGKWTVTYDALKNSINSLMSAPLIGPPEEGHEAKKVMGMPIKLEIPNGYAEVVYEITDDNAWDMIRKGLWEDVSPQVWGKGHRENDVDILDEFTWVHNAFVPKGAFPRSEVQSFCEGPECIHRLSAELFQDGDHGHIVTDGGSSIPKGTQEPDKKQYEKVELKLTDKEDKAQEIEQLQGNLKEFEKQAKEKDETIKELQGQVADLSKKNDILEQRQERQPATAEMKRVTEELRDLKEWKAQKLQDEKREKAKELADLDIRAGLLDERDRIEQTEKYMAFDGSALSSMIEKSKLIVFQVETGSPKAKFIASKQSENLEDLVRAKYNIYKPEEAK